MVGDAMDADPDWMERGPFKGAIARRPRQKVKLPIFQGNGGLGKSKLSVFLRTKSKKKKPFVCERDKAGLGEIPFRVNLKGQPFNSGSFSKESPNSCISKRGFARFYHRGGDFQD